MTNPTDEELNALVKRLDDMSDLSRDHAAGLLDLGHKVAVNQAITAITTLRAQLAEARAEIARLTDLNSTAYIDGHDAAKNEYRDEIQRLEALNTQLTVMAGEDAVAAQIDVAGRAVKVIDDRIAAILADEESIMSPARQVISQWASSVIAELENIRAALARMKGVA